MDLLTLITAKDMIDFSEGYSYQTTFIGEQLFPKSKTDNLKIAVNRLTENGSVPVMAQFHAFDTEAKIGDRANYKEMQFEKLLIKEKLNQGERVAYYLQGSTDADKIKTFIFDDASNLISRVLTRCELANMQVMATGKLSIDENNFKTVVDYDLPKENKLVVTGWNTPTHDIIGDLNKIKASAKRVGKVIDKALTSSKVIGYMLKNEAIVKAFTNANSSDILTETRLINWLQSNFQIAFVADDEVYKESANSKTLHRFYPEDKITFFGGNTAIGAGLFTLTPAELISESAKTNGYCAIDMWKEKDPEAIWTKAEAVYLPVIKDIEGLFICDVNA